MCSRPHSSWTIDTKKSGARFSNSHLVIVVLIVFFSLLLHVRRHSLPKAKVSVRNRKGTIQRRPDIPSWVTSGRFAVVGLGRRGTQTLERDKCVESGDGAVHLMRRVGRSDVGPISTNHTYDHPRNVGHALGCGYTLSPGSRVIRGPRAARRRRSDYKPVLLQCGIITQDEFDALRGIELLGFGDAREQATVKTKDRSFSCGHDEPKLSSFLRRFVENVAPARDQSRDQIQLSDLAFELGVAPRRLYNIVTVLESLGIVEQGGEKGTFRWKGTDHMRGIPDYTMLNEDCFSDSEWSVASNGNCENGMSIWSLSRKYVTLLQSKQVVHTTEAAEKLCELSGRCRHGAAKALEIQISEIAGLLVELGLARKIGSNTRARSSAYKWAGFEHPRRIVRANGTRRNGSRGGSDRAKETTDHMDRSNPTPQDSNRRDIGFRDSVRLAGHSGTEASCPPPNYTFQPHPSSSSAPPPFTHFPMPLTVLSNASVVQLNQPSAMSMSHQAAEQPGQVRSLTSPYGDQYFGILPLGGHDGLDGKGMNGMSRIDPALSITNSSKSGLPPGRQTSTNASTPSMFTPMVAYAVSNGRGLAPDESSKPSSISHRHVSDLGNHSRGRVNGDTPSVAHRKDFESSMLVGQSLGRGLGRMEGNHRGQVGGERQHHNPVWHVPKSRGNRGDSNGFIPPNSLIHTMATVSDREDGAMRSSRHEIRGGGGVGALERWPGENTRNKVLKKDISSLMNLLARGAVANGAQDGYRTTQANSSPREMTNAGGNIRQLQ
ncbi:hypothetical protein BSKO_04642 [Bryopsis sp. KO-2023]|nr:hypothetical protein BSKO_04642 [Bryopsis sp. KO-2023]